MTECGDGIRAGAEQCDDDNLDPGDGCSVSCVYERRQEIEDNQDWTIADINPIEPGWLYEGSVSSPPDYDVFHLHLTTISDLKIEVAGPDGPGTCTATDTDMDVYLLDGTLLAHDNDSGPLLCPELNPVNSSWTHQVQPGDYYIRVRTSLPDTASGPYTIVVTLLTECGDGEVEGFEQCEGSAGCDACQRIPVCGNAFIDRGEQCDDGDLDPGDGCDGECFIEADHRCTGMPSVCTRIESLCNDAIDDDNDGRTDGSDADCALAVAAGACNSGETQAVFTSKDTPREIGGVLPVESTIRVPTTGTVRRAVVRLIISHEDTSNLGVFLHAPMDVSVELSTGNGGMGQGFVSTVLDDACPASVTTGNPPFSGCYAPEGQLGMTQGGPARGPWTLTAQNTVGLRPGQANLLSWSLMLCVAP